MPLRKFESLPKDQFASDWEVFYANYGTTVYAATLGGRVGAVARRVGS
jgi:hypothetical protein